MAVVSPYIFYIGNTAYDLRKVSAVAPAQDPLLVEVRFIDEPKLTVLFNKAAFEAAWQSCLSFTPVPAGGTVTSVNVVGGTTGLTTSGGPVTSTGTITLDGTLSVTHGGTGATTAAAARTNLGLGNSATRDVGTTAGTVAAGDDHRLGADGVQALTLAATTYVLDSLDITQYRTTHWAVEFKKGTSLLILELVATHNGTTAAEVRPVSMLMGAAADVAAVVDINGGNMRLTVSANSTGWTATWRRLFAMAA